MNKTGIEPIRFSVLIQVDEVDHRTAGGLWLTEDTIEREQMAHDRGILIAKAEMAFEDEMGIVPEVGDNVIFKKYAGTIIKHRDEKRDIGKYRLCQDKEVFAIINEKGEE